MERVKSRTEFLAFFASPSLAPLGQGCRVSIIVRPNAGLPQPGPWNDASAGTASFAAEAAILVCVHFGATRRASLKGCERRGTQAQSFQCFSGSNDQSLRFSSDQPRVLHMVNAEYGAIGTSRTERLWRCNDPVYPQEPRRICMASSFLPSRLPGTSRRACDRKPPRRARHAVRM